MLLVFNTIQNLPRRNSQGLKEDHKEEVKENDQNKRGYNRCNKI
jgi:hypothetical protein